MMKTLLTLGILGAAGALSICDLCPTGSSRPVASLVSVAHATPLAAYTTSVVPPAADTKTITVRVEGMTCGGCVIGVRKVLTRLDGVAKAEVSYEQQRAVVTYDPAKVTVEQMIAAIKTLGYKATVVTG
ncbi:MAG TPA: metal-binding (seleno)protein [Gemmatimonadaceae bacterium]|nr:metal-binding (seleno)protein [Gemmatimonadaceae bacterium]